MNCLSMEITGAELHTYTTQIRSIIVLLTNKLGVYFVDQLIFSSWIAPHPGSKATNLSCNIS